MKHCPHCACMVTPGSRCWSCGAPVPAEMPTNEAATARLTNKLNAFVGRTNDAETREEIAAAVERSCQCGGEFEVEELPEGVTAYTCHRCGTRWVRDLPPSVAIIVDANGIAGWIDRGAVGEPPPTKTDEGFDLMGCVGRVRRKTR
ncbi:MAG TPA: hypothetical protein PLY45_04105 [bacterium]|nr:hypothetical protein [bacterium]